MTTPDATTAAGTAASGGLQTFTAGHHRQIVDGNVALEGSTNWSCSGECAGINLGPDRTNQGLMAQNNTPVLYVNAYAVAKFCARLDHKHAVAAHQPQAAI
jgi:hypothetical protein